MALPTDFDNWDKMISYKVRHVSAEIGLTGAPSIVKCFDFRSISYFTSS